MNYTLILGILIAVAVVLLLVIIIALIVGSVKAKKYSEEEYDDEYDDGEDEYDDGEDEYDDDEIDDEDDIDEDEYDDEDEDEYDDDDEEEIPVRPVKKQWKLILENLSTWEKKSIIFYDNIGIGRKRESDEFEKYYVIQDDPRISKLHCEIISSAGKLYLKDLGSRNGTYLNGKKIEKPIVLQKEDVIGIGETKIEIKKIMKEK